jgi:eukaryotic-like serine/threonine-protein kinase
MFLDEARLAARIHHPNVVPIQEVGQSERGYYLVMDYVEGDTFARLLARSAQSKTPVPPAVTIRILLDVLAGLHAAHELKDDLGEPLLIVHRDVSPQNILLGVDGIARITDFGVARAASRLTTTRSGQLKGKLAYMAPEQARGEAIDRRADIFSCGIVLWEALSLKRLFKGDGEAQTLNRVLYDPIAPPSSARPDVPKALEDVCMKALDRDVDKRFSSAQEFADELEKAARALSCVGSVREVAACLEQVVGTDLTQQRDAVRSWLVRSEPSANSSRSFPPVPDSVKTRVDGKSEPSRSKRPPASQGTRLGAIDRLAVTAPAPKESVSSDPPENVPDKVSSVSSAVLQVAQGADASSPDLVLRTPRARGRIVFGIAAAAAVLLGVAAWGATQWRGRAPATAAPTPPPPPPTVEAPAASASAPAIASAAPSSTSSGHATPAAVPATAATQVRRGSGAGPKGPPAKPTGTATAPDDLSHNPYR